MESRDRGDTLGPTAACSELSVRRTRRTVVDSSKPLIRTFTVAADGAKVPLGGTGVRIAVAPEVWLEIDFETDGPAPLSIRIGGRARRIAGAEVPSLRLQLLAGNSVSVLAGAGKPPSRPPWDVVVVNQDELKGDIREWLRRTSSGDPLGETALGDSGRARLPLRRFVVDYGDVASIQVELNERDDAVIGVDVTSRSIARPQRGVPHRSVSMVISPHAANLLSLRFGEVESAWIG